jgi:S1-C subfamily serine protease
VSFAIPIDAVNRIVPQLIAKGKVTKPALGITAMPTSFADRYGIEGVVVRSAHADGAAARAGILGHRQDAAGRWVLGDILVAIDDRPIREPNDIYRILDRHEVGDEISIALIRDNGLERVSVELTGEQDAP